MSDHHDNHHSGEKKPVSFTVPFILAVVTLTAILLLVSLGDPCHCKGECAEKCATEGAHGGHGGHEAAAGHEEKAAEHEAVKEEAATEVKADSTAKETAAPAAEEKKEEAHH